MTKDVRKVLTGLTWLKSRCWHSEILSVHSLCHHPAPSPFLAEAVCSWLWTTKKYLSTWRGFQGFLLCSQEVTWAVSTNGINACRGKHCISYSSLRSTLKCPCFSWWAPSSQFNLLLLPPNSLLGCSFRQNHCSLSDLVSIRTTHAHSRLVFPFVHHPSCCRFPNSRCFCTMLRATSSQLSPSSASSPYFKSAAKVVVFNVCFFYGEGLHQNNKHFLAKFIWYNHLGVLIQYKRLRFLVKRTDRLTRKRMTGHHWRSQSHSGTLGLFLSRESGHLILRRCVSRLKWTVSVTAVCVSEHSQVSARVAQVMKLEMTEAELCFYLPVPVDSLPLFFINPISYLCFPCSIVFMTSHSLGLQKRAESHSP